MKLLKDITPLTYIPRAEKTFKSKQASSIKTNIKLIQEQIQKPVIREKTMEKIYTGEKTLIIPKEKEILKEKLIPRIVEKEKTLTKTQEKLIQKEKIMQKQLNKQMQKQKLMQKILQKRIPIKPIRVPPFQYKTKFPKSIGEKKKKVFRGSSFEIFKIVKRKPVRVSGGYSKGTALDLAIREASKDLTATVGIRKSDIPLRDIQTYGEFQRYKQLFREPAKKSPYRKYGDIVLVQKQKKVGTAGGRLTFFGEKSAIQRARMNKIMNIIK